MSNSRLQSTLVDNMFSYLGYNRNSNIFSNEDIDYFSNNVFSHFLKVNCREDIIEVPIFMNEYITTAIVFNIQISHVLQDVVIPFYKETNRPVRCSTTLQIIKRLIEYIPCTYKGMYHEVQDTKNNIYYGSNGIILNSSMHPLMFPVLESKIKQNILVYEKLKVFIHPSVFQSKNIVESYIRKSIIPLILTEGVNFFNVTSFVTLGNTLEEKHFLGSIIPEIVIADVYDKFFCTPISSNGENREDDIYDLLNTNIEEVFNIMHI